MNFQVTVLKILVSYPEGFAVMDDIKRDMAILATSGREWSDRTKRLAARVPELDIFSQGLVDRESGGWKITEKGRTLLDFMEGAHQRRTADRGGSPDDSRRARAFAATARGAGEAKAGTARASSRRTRAGSSDGALKCGRFRKRRNPGRRAWRRRARAAVPSRRRSRLS